MGTVMTPAQSGKILSDDDQIMVPEKGSKLERPEPWLAPKYQSPSGTVQHVRYSQIENRASAERYRPRVRLRVTDGTDFSEFAVTARLSRGGAETFQDRAIRCTHQAGVYGQVGANRGQLHGLLPLAGQIHARGYKSKAWIKSKTAKATGRRRGCMSAWGQKRT
jgi:hypothetical protein